MMNWSVPTIAGIQRASAIVALVLSAVLFVAVSPQVGLGCLIGGALMIANLYAWALIGRSILSLAHANQGSHPAGLLLAPLKLVILIVLVYLLITHVSINLPGFMAGLLTQFVAIFIETWRVSRTAEAPRAGESPSSIKD
jgi:small-conductance mechanosensitive channel